MRLRGAYFYGLFIAKIHRFNVGCLCKGTRARFFFCRPSLRRCRQNVVNEAAARRDMLRVPQAGHRARRRRLARGLRHMLFGLPHFVSVQAPHLPAVVRRAAVAMPLLRSIERPRRGGERRSFARREPLVPRCVRALQPETAGSARRAPHRDDELLHELDHRARVRAVGCESRRDGTRAGARHTRGEPCGAARFPRPGGAHDTR